MIESHHDLGTKRRGLFGRLAGLVTLASAATTAEAASDAPKWPGVLKGRHRQLVDGTQINAGSPLAYAQTFLMTNPGAGMATAVVVLRHMATPIALNHEIWAKYKIGASLHIDDPETNAPAVKNPFLQPKPGVLVRDEMAINRLIANGAIIGACNMAIEGLSKKLASNAGLSAEDAARDWRANLVPGVTVIPAGTWGVNRAQEAGCTYCSGA